MTRRDIWQQAARQLRESPKEERLVGLRSIHEMIGADLVKLRGAKHWLRFIGREPISDRSVTAIADRLEGLDPESVHDLEALDLPLHGDLPSPRRFKRDEVGRG